MKKKHAFILALVLTVIIAVNVLVISDINEPKRKQVTVKRVIDGDTFQTYNNETIRLANINSPEKGSHGSEEAKDFLSKLENSTIEIEIIKIEKYGRFLARVYTADYLNLEIVEKGLAKKFLVEQNELTEFNEAEKQAIENSRGMWTKSEYYGCFNTEINEKEETVKITNTCRIISIKDWTIEDESRKKYKFHDISLGEVNLHSQNGEDSETDLFWSSSQNIWNNDRDTLYLFDKNEKIAHHETYGY